MVELLLEARGITLEISLETELERERAFRDLVTKLVRLGLELFGFAEKRDAWHASPPATRRACLVPPGSSPFSELDPNR